jgi:hypothetical protein
MPMAASFREDREKVLRHFLPIVHSAKVRTISLVRKDYVVNQSDILSPTGHLWQAVPPELRESRELRVLVEGWSQSKERERGKKLRTTPYAHNSRPHVGESSWRKAGWKWFGLCLALNLEKDETLIRYVEYSTVFVS